MCTHHPRPSPPHTHSYHIKPKNPRTKATLISPPTTPAPGAYEMNPISPSPPVLGGVVLVLVLGGQPQAGAVVGLAQTAPPVLDLSRWEGGGPRGEEDTSGHDECCSVTFQLAGREGGREPPGGEQPLPAEGEGPSSCFCCWPHHPNAAGGAAGGRAASRRTLLPPRLAACTAGETPAALHIRFLPCAAYHRCSFGRMLPCRCALLRAEQQQAGLSRCPSPVLIVRCAGLASAAPIAPSHAPSLRLHAPVPPRSAPAPTWYRLKSAYSAYRRFQHRQHRSGIMAAAGGLTCRRLHHLDIRHGAGDRKEGENGARGDFGGRGIIHKEGA